MAVVERAMLMGFRLGGDQAEDDSLAALLDAKVGEKGGENNSNELPDLFVDAGGMTDFV